ncbi:FKBP-type peptidyl-prolyl cis-trans isomerase [Sphingomonas mesophila]|uniref:FKBP-type peptidyl-prolyl cis-trans isomerase n=1 Tax=Sphingomonas mesophila TaxID=2303576 RepID=UPI000E56CA1F|nr:FKBP-type peptidyl-prolyl cis-trans isomerase [Sphingomonas mesophila]
MSATQVPLQPLKRGTLAKLWLGLALLVAAALLLAWTGAGAMRGTTTQSGIQIRTLDEGRGDPIRAMDGALIEYEGRLADGTVFDTTEGRGPAPIIPSQVIPGFGEALQQMREGGRYKIRIPAALAYGATGTPDGKIPPNSDLEFDVSVRQLVRDAALMMGAPGQGQPQPQPQPAN